MSSILCIDPKSLPYEGKQISGQFPPSFFQLEDTDPIRPTGPMEFDLVALKDLDLLNSEVLKLATSEAGHIIGLNLFGLRLLGCLHRNHQMLVLGNFK